VGVPLPSLSPAIPQEWKSPKGWSWLKGFQSWMNRPPKERVSISMLNLARANLSLRLRSIDETSLTSSERQMKIYGSVKELLRTPSQADAVVEDLGWDEIYQAESLIALLYSGERLQQEIDASLQELADLNRAEADIVRPNCQELLKRSSDGASPGSNDTVLQAYLLRLMERSHW